MRMKAHIGQFYTAMTTDNSPTQSNNLQHTDYVSNISLAYAL